MAPAGILRTLLAAALAVLAPALAGCAEPYQVHVDPATLAKSSVHWREAVGALQDSGLLGSKSQRTDYDVPSDATPPPAHLELYGLRSARDPGAAELLNRSRAELSAYAQRVGIAITPGGDRAGNRATAQGLATTWLTQEGTATTGDLFTRNYKVRLVAEVAYDAGSHTALIALGVAQVESSRCLLGSCRPSPDATSWTSMVGDPDGVIGATDPNGLLHHVVTH